MQKISSHFRTIQKITLPFCFLINFLGHQLGNSFPDQVVKMLLRPLTKVFLPLLKLGISECYCLILNPIQTHKLTHKRQDHCEKWSCWKGYCHIQIQHLKQVY